MKKNLFTLLFSSGLVSAFIFIACKHEPPAGNLCDMHLTYVVEGDVAGGSPEGSIIVSAVGGSEFMFSIDNNVPIGNGHFTGLAGNTEHTIVVTNDAGCKDSVKVTVPVRTNPCSGVTILVSEQHTGATVADPLGGSITATATGGSAPYTYVLSGTPTVTNTTGFFTGLGNGSYIVTATSAAGCTGTSASIVLSLPCPGITVSATPSNVTSCASPNGSISASASGSTGFNYNINGGTYQALGNFTNLAAGAYTINAKDANGCTGTSTAVVVSSTPTITVSATPSNVTSCASPNGSISASATGSTGFNYNINGGAYQSSGNFTNLAAGAYTINAKDGNGCTGTTVKTIANATPTITVSGTTTAATHYVCSSDGSVSVSATGGSGPYTYTLSGTTTSSNSTGSFTGLKTGTYTITANDANGCTGTVSKTVVGPTVSFASKIKPIITQYCGRNNISCHSHSNAWTTYSDIVGSSSGSTWTSNLSTFIGRARGAGNTTSTCPVGKSGSHNMPPSSSTTWSSFMTGDFTEWVNQGYPNN